MRDLQLYMSALQEAEMPDRIPTEDSDVAPGLEVPLWRGVKAVTSLHVECVLLLMRVI